MSVDLEVERLESWLSVYVAGGRWGQLDTMEGTFKVQESESEFQLLFVVWRPDSHVVYKRTRCATRDVHFQVSVMPL